MRTLSTEQTWGWKQRLNRFSNAAIILAVITLAAVMVRHYLAPDEVGQLNQAISAAPSVTTSTSQSAKNGTLTRPVEARARPAVTTEGAANSPNCMTTQSMTADQVDFATKSGQHLVVLDIREREGFMMRHFPGAKNIPLDELEVRAINELSSTDLVVLYCGCKDDSQNKVAQGILRQQGFTCTTFLHDRSEQCNTCP